MSHLVRVTLSVDIGDNSTIIDKDGFARGIAAIFAEDNPKDHVRLLDVNEDCCLLCHDTGWVIEAKDKAGFMTHEIIPCLIPDCKMSGTSIDLVSIDTMEMHSVAYHPKDSYIMSVSKKSRRPKMPPPGPEETLESGFPCFPLSFKRLIRKVTRRRDK